MNLLSVIAASRRRVSYDADAAAYFAAIVAAGSTISDANKTAVNNFVVGCKADGIWSAIKACCLLAGPDDLTGALVPLVGSSPTNNGPFVSGDYDRTTGLLGNGSTKYLDSNRNQNAEPQNSFSLAVWITTVGASGAIRGLIGAGTTGSGASNLAADATNAAIVRNRNSISNNAGSLVTGFFGTSRSASGSYDRRISGTTGSVAVASQTPVSANTLVFSRGSTSANISNCRLSFYSIGESLDLALLDARLATYMAALT